METLNEIIQKMILLYSQKIWRFDCQIKIGQIFHRMHVCMAIPYHTAKFKSANTIQHVVWDQITKFNETNISSYTVSVLMAAYLYMGTTDPSPMYISKLAVREKTESRALSFSLHIMRHLQHPLHSYMYI